ncbi:endonuclease/exonuclease/phosphatase family protein [Actinomadura napierensis]|uniref:Endonuclease/exonuclease/phosphatase domain-containing protein n=1 Tax=Actinomadura napierensis TaxID=267854 RepID=A0ABP5LKC3_9ACTN
MQLRFRIATWNIKAGGLDGGLDSGNDARLKAQIAILADLGADLVGLQEAKWGARSNRTLNQIAHALGMTGRTMALSNHHGCHLVQLVRERPGLRVLEERHDESGSYWHALGVLRLGIDGLSEVDLLNAHLAPSSRSRRLQEAESFALWKSTPAIACGDFNAVAAACDDPDTDGLAAIHIESKLDERPAVVMERTGFKDAAVPVDDPTPTVGHDKDHLAYRCDRILWANLPGAKIINYQVIPGVHPTSGDRLSDHDLVAADLEFEVGDD